MTFPSIADGAALRSVLGWLHDAGFQHVHHRVLSIAPLTGLAQARRRWLCVATRTPTPTFAWPTPLPLSRRRVLADVLLPTPKLLHCPHIHALADRPPLTRRTPRLYQRAYRRRNTQHSSAYTTSLAWRPLYQPPAPCTYGTTAHKPGCYKYASSPGSRAGQ